MLNKIANYQLLITDKLQKMVLALAAIMMLAAAVCAAEAQATSAAAVSPENTTPVVKYGFKLYVLSKGAMKKNTTRPDFGWRVMKAFPLKVKEFTYPAPYMDFSAPEFRAAADNILAFLDEPRRKNAVRVADAVFAYINTTIAARIITEEISETPHKVYFSAQQALKAGAGSSLEKCRLATAMLRYFSIPARIVSRENSYEVEYYIQPLSEQGKGAWYLYNFSGNGQAEDEFYIPAAWHPIDAKELLNEEWETPMFLKLNQQKRSFISGNDAEVFAVFASLTQTGKNITDSMKPKKGMFYVIDELDYELWLQPGTLQAKAEFTLPFNLEDQFDIADDFKTVKYYIETRDEKLSAKCKWPLTRTKPSQEGIIYVLPVNFSVKNASKISDK